MRGDQEGTFDRIAKNRENDEIERDLEEGF